MNILSPKSTEKLSIFSPNQEKNGMPTKTPSEVYYGDFKFLVHEYLLF